MDEVQEPGQPTRSRGRRWARSAALVGSGVVAGAILAGTLTANAADGEAGSSTADDGAVKCADRPGGGGPRGNEEELTGETATAVTDAVLAEYPDATIVRLETDSDGVYEAHIVTAEDERLTVELDESFAVTGTETHDAAGRRPGRGPGDRGDGPDDGGTDGTAPDDGGTRQAEPTD